MKKRMMNASMAWSVAQTAVRLDQRGINVKMVKIWLLCCHIDLNRRQEGDDDEQQEDDKGDNIRGEYAIKCSPNFGGIRPE